MKIQIPHFLLLTQNINSEASTIPVVLNKHQFYKSLKSRHKKGAVVTILSWLRPLP